VSFVTLEQISTTPTYASFLHHPLLRSALKMLPDALASLPGCLPLNPARVWIGIAAPPDAGWFGGFYHADQGYRYLQQIALTSLSGALSRSSIDGTLRTLELLRAYVHDALHHATYRLFCPMPAGVSSDQSFYRLQYAMNFRRWDGRSYSAKDSARSPVTRNLGNIMEAATDRFAQEFVLCLAKTIAYCPSGESLLETMVYRDCTGQLTNEDVLSLRALERRVSASDLLPEEAAYLKQMRLFVQYVTMRYQAFLATYNAQQREELHAQILQGMISGKLSTLCAFLDTLQGGPRSFVALFKTPDY
jgi:hypothetical protein